VLALLVGISYAFAGTVGIGVFVVAGALGLVPPRVGARRVHLMGVLIGPLIAGEPRYLVATGRTEGEGKEQRLKVARWWFMYERE